MNNAVKMTLDVECWKELKCSGCESKYRYKLKRTVFGEGRSAPEVRRYLRGNAVSLVAKEVDYRACPVCGCYQSDIIGYRKGNRHIIVAVAIMILLGIMLTLGMKYDAYSMTYSRCGIIGAALSLIALTIHALIVLRNPNSNPEVNRTAELYSKGVELVSKQNTDIIRTPRSRSFLDFVLLFGILTGAMMCATPFVLKSSSSWPTVMNNKPEIVSPGDALKVYYPSTVSSVNGHWSGRTNIVKSSPEVIFANIDKPMNWTLQIHAEGGKVSEATDVYSIIVVPNSDKLAGQTVTLDLQMHVSYPVMVGDKKFENQNKEINTTTTFTIAPVGASQNYIITAAVAALGVLLVICCSFGLVGSAYRLKRFACRSTVTPIVQDHDNIEEEAPRPKYRVGIPVLKPVVEKKSDVGKTQEDDRGDFDFSKLK